MNFLSNFIPEPLLKAIGWTLVHSLWQGILVAILLAVLLIALQRRTAVIRYFLSVISMLTWMMISVFTFIKEYTYVTSIPSGQGAITASKIYAVGFPLELTTTAAGLVKPQQWSWADYTLLFNNYFHKHLPLVVLLWSIGIAIYILRFIGAYAYTQRLKHYKTVKLPHSWQLTLQTLAQRAAIKQPVQLVESALVKVPMVIGYLKPLILLPIGTVTGMPAEQVEAILAHELAHIYRKDYVVNIMQSVVEIVFFYHPAIWWISARIREEREHCCDDMALTICGNSLTFAKALANLENAYAGAPLMALGFAGNSNQLLTRIKRLIHEPRRTPNFAEGFLAACVVMISLTAITVSAGSNMLTSTSQYSIDLPEALSPKESTIALIAQDGDSTKNVFTFKGTKNGKKYDIKAIMQRGTIVTLFVNGKKIPDSQKSNYYDLIYDLLEDVPAPPAPEPVALAPEPDFPAEPVIAPAPALAPDPDIEEMHGVLVPADAFPLVPALEPMPPFPAIAPMDAETIVDIIRAAFAGDTSQMRKGNFDYHFTGKKDKTYKITIKDGVLTELRVDGKKISKEEYGKYTFIMDEIEEDAHARHAEAMARQEEARQRYDAQLQMRREHTEQMRGQMHQLQLQKKHMTKENTALARRRAEELRIQERETEQRFQAQELQLQRQQQEMERSIQAQERAMREHERAMIKQKESERLSKELTSALNTQLVKDNLVQKNKKHYVQLSEDGLFIDRVKQPEKVFRKYKELIEKKAGKPLEFTIQYYYNQDQEDATLEQDQSMAKHIEAEKMLNELVTLLNTHLQKENLVTNQQQYHIRINPEGLYIDDVRQPEEVFNRYKKVIEEKTGKPFVYTLEYEYKDEL